jgi:hypothetical protein
MTDDPFDRLGDGTDREGDPFDRLGDGRASNGNADGDEETESPPVDDRTGSPPVDDRATAADADSTAGTGERAAADTSPERGTGGNEPAVTDREESDGDATPGWLERGREEDGGPTVDRSRGSGTATDDFEDGDELFERMAVERVDDAVWDRLGTSRESADESGERDVATVSKHAFCERCEHFSPPPEIECGHEGTAILEFPDMESVRVADCPVVAERRDLADREQL